MRVLLVEDEPSLAETIRRGLEAEGWVVEVAVDGVEGLRRGSELPEVVLRRALPVHGWGR